MTTTQYSTSSLSYSAPFIFFIFLSILFISISFRFLSGHIIVKILLIFITYELIFMFFFIGFFKFRIVCHLFAPRRSPSPHAEMIRQIQLNADCGHLEKTTIPIRKYIIDPSSDNKNPIVGAISGNTLILKGTDDFWSTIKDLTIKPERFHEGRAHRGALELYKKIRPQIINEDIQTITGWSLGASVGTLAGYDIYKTHGRKPMLYLYAPIPTMDSTLKKAYNKALYSHTKLYINPFDFLSYPFTGKYGHLFVDSLARLHHVGDLQKKYPYNNLRYIFAHLSYM